MELQPFDYIKVQKGIISWLKEVVGSSMGKMLIEEGNSVITTDIPAVYAAPLGDLPEPSLPFIEVNYIQNDDGFVSSSGVVDVKDPNDDSKTLSVPYYDTMTNFSITLVCEGTGAQNIIRKVRNLLNVHRERQKLHERTNSGINYITRARRSPDFITTEFRESSTLTFSMNALDRYIDYDGNVFSSVDYNGGLKRTEDDNNPLPIDRKVDPYS